MFGSVEAYMRLAGVLHGTMFEVTIIPMPSVVMSTSNLCSFGQMSNSTATFFAGGLAAFSFWAFAIPMDNVKKYVNSLERTHHLTNPNHLCPVAL